MDTFSFYLLISFSPYNFQVLLAVRLGLIIYREWLDGKIINVMTGGKIWINFSINN